MKNNEEARMKLYKNQSDELIELVYAITDSKLAGKQKNDFSEEDKNLASAVLTLQGALKMFAAVYSQMR